MFSTLPPQVQGVKHASLVAIYMYETYMFRRLNIGLLKTSDEHDLLFQFLKLNPRVFNGTEFEDACDFMVYFHGMLQNMNIYE